MALYRLTSQARGFTDLFITESFSDEAQNLDFQCGEAKFAGKLLEFVFAPGSIWGVFLIRRCWDQKRRGRGFAGMGQFRVLCQDELCGDSSVIHPARRVGADRAGLRWY